MIKKQTAVTVLIVLLLIHPTLLAQTRSSQTASDWSAVKSVPVAAELDVKLKRGKSVKGSYVSSSDAEITLSVRKNFTRVGRDEVRRVSIVVPNSRGDSAAVGAAIGSLLAFAGINGANETPVWAAMLAFGVIGMGIGALVGLVVAKPHKRVLIYEAK